MLKCKTCSFNSEDIFRMMTMTELEKECPMIKFYQNGKCYCFCLIDIYKWIFGTEDPEETEIVNDKNPQTNAKFTKEIINLVKEEYQREYGEKLRQVMPKGISMKEIQDFKTGVDTFKTAFENSLVGRKINFNSAINMYLEDLLELTEGSESEKFEAIAEIVRSEYKSLGMI